MIDALQSLVSLKPDIPLPSIKKPIDQRGLVFTYALSPLVNRQPPSKNQQPICNTYIGSNNSYLKSKKLIRGQACWAKFLSGFNFLISYMPDKENLKADSLTRRLNNLPSDNNNDCQQYLLQTILLAKRLEIILIKKQNNSTIVDQVVQANLEDSYCSKLCYSLKNGYPTKEIDSRHFSDLSVDSKNCICRFDRL